MKILKKLYDKSRIWFAVAWIIAYCVLLSVGDNLSALLGVEKSVTFPIALLLSVLLVVFLGKYRLFEAHGVCLSEAKPRTMLFYIPVLIMLTANFWQGIGLNYSIAESLLYILSMLCVGLLEELIFRGLLFNAMRKDSFGAAVIVSSVTFGIGHIINLVNGSGAELVPNLLQVLYATAAGFMFVMMYCVEGSLLTCIIAHGLFNSFSAFSRETSATQEMRIITAILLTFITGSYAVYLAIVLKKTAKNNKM